MADPDSGVPASAGDAMLRWAECWMATQLREREFDARVMKLATTCEKRRRKVLAQGCPTFSPPRVTDAESSHDATDTLKKTRRHGEFNCAME